MKQYELFTEEDFIGDPEFQDWVLHADENSEAFWQQFLDAYPQKKVVLENARNFLEQVRFREHRPSPETIERSLNEALVKINRQAPAKLVRMRAVYRWLSVAAVVLLVVTAGYWLLRQKQAAPVNTTATRKTQTNPIVPGGDKAILTLADGSRIVLDSAGRGTLASQGRARLVQNGGALVYQDGGESAVQNLFNTVTTPRGGQYQLLLADGTRIWLNAASSLRYPAVFSGKDRVVELSGEAYFEVAHDASKPFHVRVNGMDVQVLGTHFNINSYPDEPVVKTTLLEGRVKVSDGPDHVFLNPGQQAMVSAENQHIRIKNAVDVDEVVAWKYGRFVFNSTNLDAIMRQAARWYNVDVNFEGKTEETFSGNLPRSGDITELLKILEATGKVHFEIKGRQLVVTPTI